MEANAEGVVCDAEGRIPDVTPGRYHVLVEPGATTELASYWIPVLVEEEVQVHEGSETVLDVTATELGGRLELFVTAEGRNPRWDSWGSHAPRASYAVTPLGAGTAESDPHGLRFFAREKDGLVAVDEVAPGRSATSDPPLPPGKYELAVYHFGYRVERVLVDVRAGRTTPVRVHLRPDEDR